MTTTDAPFAYINKRTTVPGGCLNNGKYLAADGVFIKYFGPGAGNQPGVSGVAEYYLPQVGSVTDGESSPTVTSAYSARYPFKEGV